MKLTLNIDEALYFKLKQFVPARQLSKFVARSIENALVTEEDALAKAYKEAYSDEKRNSESKEWDSLILDGLKKTKTAKSKKRK